MADKQVAIVTGTARGIGRACAEAFLASGWSVVGLDKDDADDLPGDYRHRRGDVADAAALTAAVEAAGAELGRIDALVNNAGWHPPTRPIDEVSTAEFVALLQLNLVSVFAASKAALPYLRQSRGAIVNIASLVALVGQEGAVEYCASKGGIVGLTKALAIDEGRHGVRVNTVCPGAIRTPLAESIMNEDQFRVIGQWAWMERLGSPAEVADVVLWLASERSSFVTGQDVVVSGGAELGYGLKADLYYKAMEAGG